MNNTRISTGMAYNQSVNLMLAKQSELSKLQQQLATGEKFSTAKDNPVGAGTAVTWDRALAELERHGENANNVQNRLGMQENVLAQAGELTIRVKELTVQANSAALSADDRRAISAELRTIKDSLLALANTSDGSGRYLFAGAADDSIPFTQTNGVISYSGDQTQRHYEIAPDTFVKDALPGSEVFMRIRTGDGTVDASTNTANTGSLVLSDITRDATGGWDGNPYTVRFTAADTYEVVDSSNAVVATGTYTSGQQISAQGLRITLTGTPAVGDSVDIGSASTRDAFSTLDRLITALEMDTSTAVAQTQQQNLLQSSLRDVSQMAETMIDARAAGGAQLIALDDATSLRDSNIVTLKTSLSAMRDLDYAEAIGQYQLESTALQASQTIFTQMQSMSLFNSLR